MNQTLPAEVHNRICQACGFMRKRLLLVVSDDGKHHWYFCLSCYKKRSGATTVVDK